MDVAERRRQKLLARGNQLDSRGGAANPSTAKKQEEEVKVEVAQQ